MRVSHIIDIIKIEKERDVFVPMSFWIRHTMCVGSIVSKEILKVEVNIKND